MTIRHRQPLTVETVQDRVRAVMRQLEGDRERPPPVDAEFFLGLLWGIGLSALISLVLVVLLGCAPDNVCAPGEVLTSLCVPLDRAPPDCHPSRPCEPGAYHFCCPG